MDSTMPAAVQRIKTLLNEGSVTPPKPGAPGSSHLSASSRSTPPGSTHSHASSHGLDSPPSHSPPPPAAAVAAAASGNGYNDAPHFSKTEASSDDPLNPTKPSFSAQSAKQRKLQQARGLRTKATWSFLAGLAFVFWSWQAETRKHAPRHPSVSLAAIDYLDDECKFLKTLPYTPANAPQGLFTPHGLHSFVFISSHRVSAWEFGVVALSARIMRSPLLSSSGGCLWVSFEGPKGIKGKLELMYPEDDDAYKYETVIYRCYLEDGTSDMAGGSLFMDINGEDVLVHKELPGKRDINPPTPLQRKLAFCSVFNEQQLSIPRVAEQLQYLRFLGADYFLLFDGGAVNPQLIKALSPLSRLRMLDVVDLRGLAHYSVPHDSVVANDCMFRTRFIAKWTLFASFDEYPSPIEPQTLPKILAANSGRPWITMGTHFVHLELCNEIDSKGPKQWPVERMVFSKPKAHCTNSTMDSTQCPGEAGLRRVIFDPRQVKAILPHSCPVPATGGVHLKTTAVRNNRFDRLTAPASLLCEYHLMGNRDGKMWKRNMQLSKVIRQGKMSGLIDEWKVIS